MKPKRVYVYFVDGKRGHRIVLSHDKKLRIPFYEYPIADFVPKKILLDYVEEAHARINNAFSRP